MAETDPLVLSRVQAAIGLLARDAEIVAAYLFGSQIDGTADRWSDIDLAVFIEGLESWGLRDRVRASVRVQRQIGDEIELHLFPARALRNDDPASLAAWVMAHGIPVLSTETTLPREANHT